MVCNDVFKNRTSHNSQQNRAIVGCLTPVTLFFFLNQSNIHFSPDSKDFTSVNSLWMLVRYGTMSSTASFKNKGGISSDPWAVWIGTVLFSFMSPNMAQFDFILTVFTAVQALPINSTNIPVKTNRIFQRSGWAGYVSVPGKFSGGKKKKFDINLNNAKCKDTHNNNARVRIKVQGGHIHFGAH